MKRDAAVRPRCSLRCVAKPARWLPSSGSTATYETAVGLVSIEEVAGRERLFPELDAARCDRRFNRVFDDRSRALCWGSVQTLGKLAEFESSCLELLRARNTMGGMMKPSFRSPLMFGIGWHAGAEFLRDHGVGAEV